MLTCAMNVAGEDDTTAAQIGKLTVGWMLDQLAIGMVMFGLVVIAAGLLSASGATRVTVVLVGVVGVVAPFIAWRRHWPDRLQWLAFVPLTVILFAAFFVAIG